MHIYSAYSLTIFSELELPGFRQVFDGRADVSIKKTGGDGDFHLDGEKVCFSRTADGLEFCFPFGATYVVSEGNCITIRSKKDTDPRLVVLALQGVVLAALLSQRGMMVLHASAIALHGRGIIVIGDKGQGKTTLALNLLASGGRLLSDDVTALSFAKGRIMVHPGPPLIKAWPDSLNYVGVDPQGCARLFDETEKRLFTVPALETSLGPVELNGLFFLQEAETVAAREMSGAEKMMYLGASVYLARFEGLRSGKEIGRDFKASALLAQQCNAYVIERPRKKEFLKETCREIMSLC